jgi:hypothetical protein
MSNLPPLRWDFCLECEESLTSEQIAEDDSICKKCMREVFGEMLDI